MHYKFEAFAALHVPGDPLILYNAWDVGSAKAVARAGARAIGTGSWSVAAALGYDDGEQLPLDLALSGAARIAGAVDLPVSIDFEGCYAIEPMGVAANMTRLAQTGAIGCNFEDRVIGGEGLHPIDLQASRIGAARRGAGASFFINARIDLFLHAPAERHGALMTEAIERALAYGEAGADGIFVPGLRDGHLVADFCDAGIKPVNVIPAPVGASVADLAQAGVARISYGPRPYREMMRSLEQAAQAAFAWDQDVRAIPLSQRPKRAARNKARPVQTV
ncbi:MAG: isocitrate lyase/phosphoenolpyruvate mutase family protein [Pseudomonadota bacterium]|nr:isocitrate lyase/phosphoenolpyruvate mutase family protein [Pseudomonadota bacterium]